MIKYLAVVDPLPRMSNIEEDMDKIVSNTDNTTTNTNTNTNTNTANTDDLLAQDVEH